MEWRTRSASGRVLIPRQLMQTPEQIMQRCLDLASHGLGAVSPNPLVGAIITHRGRVIGQGFHERFGGPHAEVRAIAAVKNKALLADSILYVNLEPCCHQGKTPPCTDLILQSKIPAVVVGCLDPFPQVSGKGVEVLRTAGVNVTVGVLEDRCRDLNRRFLVFHTRRRPYVILKWAETKDGFIAREDQTSKWISSEASRVLLHRWRSEESAIVIGTNTALLDNPQLTVRHVPGTNPVRIVIDRTLRLPPDLHLFDGSVRTLIFHEGTTGQPQANLEYIQVTFGESVLEQILSRLYDRQLLSCIVEGGARLLNSFIQRNLWDEARVFVSPQKFGMGLRGPLLGRTDFHGSRIGADELRIFRNKAP